MLLIEKVHEIPGDLQDGWRDTLTIYEDSDKFNVFYPIPHKPRYRLGPGGRPSFAFYKYRFPVDRPDGKKGGGFLLFDVEFVVDEKLLQTARQVLGAQVAAEASRRGISPVPDVVFANPTFTKGTCALLFPAGFVDREVPSGGTPSLFGNNVSTFALELSPEGATFFEQAMQSQGGAVAVVYQLWFWARLPPVKIRARFHASKFYSFYQSIDTDWNLWAEDSYRETVRQQMISSEAMTIKVEGGGVTDEKILGPLRDWATRSLEKAVERNMIDAIAPVPDDQRKAPDGIEDVTRNISDTRISDVFINYDESKTVDWFFAPRGTLPNITTLKDASGAPIKWSDYARTIDLDDPFFRTLRVNTFVNADFKGLPIHSVEVKLVYKGRPMHNLTEGEPEGEVVMNDEGDMGKFAEFVQGDDWKYTYSYQVNYRGESRFFQSPDIETNETNLTIGVDDVGLLSVKVSAGDLNWTELDRVAVELSYADEANGVAPIEEQFQLTQASPDHDIQRVIFQPLRNKYTYRARYYMKGGKEFQGPDKQARADRLYINDVFDARKTVALRGIGDFAGRIATIFVDLDYTDAANGYSQTKSQALTGQSPFFEWTFPVINEKAGTLSYKAMIAYRDGTTETVPLTTVEGGTIVLPPAVAEFMDVNVVTDLIDWSQLRLVRVALSYSDPANGVSLSKDLIFSPTNKATAVWRVELKNRQKNDYTYAITYYLTGGLQKTVPATVTKDRAIILDPNA